MEHPSKVNINAFFVPCNGVRHLWLALLLALFPLALSAQDAETGAIAGRVLDSWQGSPVAGVTVLVRGTTLGTTTDSTGNFIVTKVPPGTYAVVLTRSGYSKATLAEVRVVAGQKTPADYSLKPEFYEMEAFEAVAEPILDQAADIMIGRQEAVVTMEALGGAQLSKLGVSDAAEALTKVTGASLVDGKFAVIRGLSDRYTSATLNGAEIPSADPYRKSAQLDLFPSSMIERIEVTKTFSPDQPGGFTGGAINIVSKSFPEKTFFDFSLGVAYNTQSSLNDDFLTSPGGGLDWLGMDDGIRELPGLLADPDFVVPRVNTGQNALLNELTRSFKLKEMGPVSEKSLLNHSFALSGGSKSQLFGRDLGYYGSLNYEHKYHYYEDGFLGRYAPSQGRIDAIRETKDTRAVEEVSWGAIVGLAYRFGEESEVSFLFVNTQTGENEARRLVGTDIQSPDDVYDSVTLKWTERKLQSYQFKGSHVIHIPAQPKLDWTVSLASTTQDEPDARYTTMFHRPNGQTTFNNAAFPAFPSRFSRMLDEQNQNFKVDTTWPFEVWSGLEASLKTGLYRSMSDRLYSDRGFGYDSRNSYVPWAFNGDPTQFLPIEEARTTTSDFFLVGLRPNKYVGSQQVDAIYGMMELPVVEKLKFVGGIRYESTEISIESSGGTLSTTTASSYIKQVNPLPALGLIYSPITNMNIRLNFGKTIARPTYREIANVATFDFAGDEILVGNPNLKLVHIDNYDLRWEWFPRSGYVLSVGGFLKDLAGPIEKVYQTLDQKTVSYENRERARVYGFEAESRVTLGFLEPKLNDFSVGVNYAWIQSETDLTAAELVNKTLINPNTPSTRQMYDQSPYILNVDFSYDNARSGTSFTVAYNMTGPRLAIVNPFGEDIYETTGDSLNLSLSQKLGKRWKVKLSAKNLLNPVFERTYGEGGTYIYSSYTKGREFGLSFSYSY